MVQVQDVTIVMVNKADDSSDHPNKAIISVQSDRGTSYGMYITVQNELLAAYTELRNRYAKTHIKGQYAGNEL